MSSKILRGDVFTTLPTLKPKSVDCCVTSPPYWKLRTYLPANHPLKHLELGSEATPQEYVANQVRVMGLVREALADHGTVWLNCGDTYTHPAGKRKPTDQYGAKQKTNGYAATTANATAPGLDPGNLCLIPQRLMIALQDDGWIVRSVVVWCLSPSTVLYAKTATTEGPMTIHDLVRLDPSTVKLWTGEKWSQVRGWSANEAAGDTRRIILRSGEAINCTATHKWPLADGRVLTAGELREGDVLTMTTLPEPADPSGIALDDLAWFAGLYLAEGNLNDDCVCIAGHTKEVERHAEVAAIAKKYGGSATLCCEGDTTTQRVHGRVLLGAIEHFIAGKGAKGKHFHPRAWLASNGVLHSLLRGYLDGDGHWDEKNYRWRLGFCRNNALAQDLRTVAARLGLTLTLNATYAKMGRIKTFEAYRGEIRYKALEAGSARPRGEIMKIERGWGGTYYDIGIADEPHLFALASGVLTHNCKPAPMPNSVAGWRWVRHRIKLKSLRRQKQGYAGAGGHRDNSGGLVNTVEVEWEDCPGCKKCDPYGGYVLRKGSWRPTSSWEPVIMLAKSESYYCDGEAVKTPPAAATVERDRYTRILDDDDEQFAVRHDHETVCDGANLRDTWLPDLESMSREDLIALLKSMGDGSMEDWWTIGPEPLRQKHYAAYPSELVARCLKAGTSQRGYCPHCGLPWCRVLEAKQQPHPSPRGGKAASERANGSGADRGGNQANGSASLAPEIITTGWRPSCSCPEHEPRPGLVLDPFSGSGRTGAAAQRLCLDYVGCELNEDFADMAEEILYQQSPLFS